MDACLGIGPMQEALWKMPKGLANCMDYFNMFKNARYTSTHSHKWLRSEIICMIDDHDQVWKPVDSKGRFCSEGFGYQLLSGAFALNLFTLGIPCIYYGTEQALDGCSDYGTEPYPADQYIREAMFGGEFGPFRTRNTHAFDENKMTYIELGKMTALRKREIALRRGLVFYIYLTIDYSFLTSTDDNTSAQSPKVEKSSPTQQHNPVAKPNLQSLPGVEYTTVSRYSVPSILAPSILLLLG
jgi:glycosidase